MAYVRVKIVIKMNIEGKRGTERPKKIWVYGIESGMRMAEVIKRGVGLEWQR